MGVTPETRLPLQGGLPPVEMVDGAFVEIACDESGWSGRNLLDLATPVFTYASVDLAAGEAVELMTALRLRLGCSPRELKSGRFLRGPGAADNLDSLLVSLRGRAHVHLIDKEYFLVTRLVDFFLAEPSYAAGTRLSDDQRAAALALYRAGQPAGRAWEVFLATFVTLLRTKRRRRLDGGAVPRFFDARDALVALGVGGQAGDVLNQLDEDTVRSVLARMPDDRSIPPPLEPILPALAETVLFWSGGQAQVLVVHDEQSALTADRLTRLQRLLAESADPPGSGGGATAAPASSPLAGLVTVNSEDDARVQLADLLAGVARRSAETGDHGALRPLLSPTSLCDPGR